MARERRGDLVWFGGGRGGGEYKRLTTQFLCAQYTELWSQMFVVWGEGGGGILRGVSKQKQYWYITHVRTVTFGKDM